MQMTMKTQDPQKARAYFENKVAFTTGPIELSHMLKSDDITIVDVREAEDYLKGHIPGAINLPHDRWDDTSSLKKDKTSIVYCYSQQCHLAANACVAFASKGFPVMELEGGFDIWENHELETEEGEQRSASQMRKAA